MTAPKEREVTGCGRCPFWGDGCEDPGRCLADPSRRESWSHDPVPDWCPLREGPITVRLRK